MKIRPHQLSKIDMKDFTLAGYSVAGEESVIVVPELDVSFDIGRCPREVLPINNVLLTHGHTDHSIGLLYYFAQRDFQGIPGGRAVVPSCLVDPFHKLIKTWGDIDGKVPPYELVGIEAGEDFEIRRDLIARAFSTHHSRGSMGFSILDIRRKLKDEYTGLEGQEIVELKEKGVEITNTVEVPLISYIGDTVGDDFASMDHVRDARVLVLECTFFEDDHKQRASAGKHIHIDELGEILEGMNNELVILSHLTRRTAISVARRIISEKLPEQLLSKITFLMSREHLS